MLCDLACYGGGGYWDGGEGERKRGRAGEGEARPQADRPDVRGE